MWITDVGASTTVLSSSSSSASPSSMLLLRSDGEIAASAHVVRQTGHVMCGADFPIDNREMGSARPPKYEDDQH